MFWNKMATKDVPRRRGMQMDENCVLCGAIAGSRDHLLLWCSYSQKIWHSFCQSLELRWVALASVVDCLIAWHDAPRRHEVGKLLWKYIPITICWGIWLERNHRIFEGVQSTWEKLRVEILGLGFVTQQNTKSRSIFLHNSECDSVFTGILLITWGSQEENQPRVQESPSQSSWYPPSVIGSSRPSTPGGSSSSGLTGQRTSSHGQVSPSEAAGIIYPLKDKSADELRKLLTDKDAYNQFLLSLDQVKIQNKVHDELQKETLQLANENLDKEPRIVELRNQCMIIRTTELAAAQEKLNELQRMKEETLKFYSPASLLKKLQDSMNQIEEESETLHTQLLEKEIDLNTFVQKYKKLRTTYHKQALTLLSAKTTHG